MKIKYFFAPLITVFIVFSSLIPSLTFGISCPDGSNVPSGKSCPTTTSINSTIYKSCPDGSNVSISQSCPQTSTINPTTGAKGGLGETPVSQNSQSNQKISIPNPLGVSTFADLIAKINRWLIMIGGPILTLMVLIGAFQIMTAGSTPDKVTEGRHTITWAVVGYGLLIISTGIAYLIKDILGG